MSLENKDVERNPDNGGLAWEVSGESLRVLQRFYWDYLFDVLNMDSDFSLQGLKDRLSTIKKKPSSLMQNLLRSESPGSAHTSRGTKGDAAMPCVNSQIL